MRPKRREPACASDAVNALTWRCNRWSAKTEPTPFRGVAPAFSKRAVYHSPLIAAAIFGAYVVLCTITGNRVYRPLLQCGQFRRRATDQAPSRGDRAVRRRRASRLSVRWWVWALLPRSLGARTRCVRSPLGGAPLDPPSGRALRHPRSRPDRGPAPAPTCCSSIPPRSASRRRAGSMTFRVPARAQSVIRAASTASSSMGPEYSTARLTRGSTKAPGSFSTAFSILLRSLSAPRSSRSSRTQ